ncbi:unnamed protein product [Adineta ricciae]|uniref:Alpha-(1,6)-fucosyltransferase N- and catalytic domain-containing protein n=1 Tax=Adineta ricciae TaxID=249248 RepID=A0A815WKQ4_ADIRI|nr:unnamed protein product [Adineta ricciae]CAF1546586.1 unnamed protein product [Adineta ricciae]
MVSTARCKRLYIVCSVSAIVICTFVTFSFQPYFDFSIIKHDPTIYYSTISGAYCFAREAPPGYVENPNVDDAFNSQHCSLENIHACQQIHNQTLLFRLHWSAGFASELNNLLRVFIYTIKTRRRLLIDGNSWNYQTFSTYFNISQGYFSPWLPSSSYCWQRQFVHLLSYQPASHTESLPEHFVITRDTSIGFQALYPIMESWEKGEDILEMKRKVAAYLWRTLNAETRDIVESYLNDIHSDDIHYAMHIRRGDKVTETNSIKTRKYIDAMEELIKKDTEKQWKNRVFVASDDANTIHELRQLKPEWNFVRFVPKTVHLHGHEQGSFDKLPQHVQIELTHILLSELEILSRVKYVVCTFSSNVCRLTQVLRKQHPSTVLSLDTNWDPL